MSPRDALVEHCALLAPPHEPAPVTIVRPSGDNQMIGVQLAWAEADIDGCRRDAPPPPPSWQGGDLELKAVATSGSAASTVCPATASPADTTTTGDLPPAAEGLSRSSSRRRPPAQALPSASRVEVQCQGPQGRRPSQHGGSPPVRQASGPPPGLLASSLP